MANESNQDSGQAQSQQGQTRQKQDPTGGQAPATKRPNPFGEQESQGNEQTRRAPGSEQEYQGSQPEQKRAPGVEQDDTIDDDKGEKRKSA